MFETTFCDRREAVGLTQAQLARQIWCPPHPPSRQWCLTLIERVEAGALPPPELWLVVRLAWVYGHGCTVGHLIEPWWKHRRLLKYAARSVSEAGASCNGGCPPRFRRRHEPVTQLGYWRCQRRLSQELLAKMAFMDVKTLAGLERRDHPAPSVGQLILLADALRLDDPAKLLLLEWLDWPSRFPPTRKDRHRRKRPRPYKAMKGRNFADPDIRNVLPPEYLAATSRDAWA